MRWYENICLLLKGGQLEETSFVTLEDKGARSLRRIPLERGRLWEDSESEKLRRADFREVPIAGNIPCPGRRALALEINFARPGFRG
jgi:hypothetical protein